MFTCKPARLLLFSVGSFFRQNACVKFFCHKFSYLISVRLRKAKLCVKDSRYVYFIMLVDQEMIVSALTLIGAVSIVLIAVFFGWFLMWKFFLSRFRFIRELLSVEEGDQEAATIGNTNKKSTKRKIRRD